MVERLLEGTILTQDGADIWEALPDQLSKIFLNLFKNDVDNGVVSMV